jgi:hypothetical protein
LDVEFGPGNMESAIEFVKNTWSNISYDTYQDTTSQFDIGFFDLGISLDSLYDKSSAYPNFRQSFVDTIISVYPPPYQDLVTASYISRDNTISAPAQVSSADPYDSGNNSIYLSVFPLAFEYESPNLNGFLNLVVDHEYTHIDQFGKGSKSTFPGYIKEDYETIRSNLVELEAYTNQINNSVNRQPLPDFVYSSALEQYNGIVRLMSNLPDRFHKIREWVLNTYPKR